MEEHTLSSDKSETMDTPTRVMGVDLGRVRIGIALSDLSAILASPFTVISHKDDAEVAINSILQIADQEHVAEIVVGIPKSLSFENTLARDSALGFISLLQNRTQIKISGYDERFTTVIASKKLRDSGHDSRTMKSKIDAMAAAEILQQYLDSRGSI
jgi:putative Holliday junction resolvase